MATNNVQNPIQTNDESNERDNPLAPNAGTNACGIDTDCGGWELNNARNDDDDEGNDNDNDDEGNDDNDNDDE